MVKVSHERINQKLRTRMALLEAARNLVARGEPVTIGAAAKVAGVSPATSYRYFSDPEVLKAEALLDHDFAHSGDLLAELREEISDVDDPTARVLAVHWLMLRFVRRNESLYRAFLARTLEQGGGGRGRGGRRIPLLEFALEPLRGSLSRSEFGDLVFSLSACVGYEPITVLTDVCHLDAVEAGRIAEQTIRRLMQTVSPGG